VLALKAPLLAEFLNLVPEATDFRGNFTRPAVRNALRTARVRTSTAAVGAVASKLWNDFRHHTFLVRDHACRNV